MKARPLASASDGPPVGSVVAACVTKVVPGGAGGVFAKVDARRVGRVHPCGVADEFVAEPWRRFKPGSFSKPSSSARGSTARWTSAPRGATSRRRRRKGKKKTFQASASAFLTALTPGQAIKGYVKQTTKAGCFVAARARGRARAHVQPRGRVRVRPCEGVPEGRAGRGRRVVRRRGRRAVRTDASERRPRRRSKDGEASLGADAGTGRDAHGHRSRRAVVRGVRDPGRRVRAERAVPHQRVRGRAHQGRAGEPRPGRERVRVKVLPRRTKRQGASPSG